MLQRQYFDHFKFTKPYLREVYSSDITPNVYAARSGLDPGVVWAFREAMLSIKDPESLSRLPIAPPIQRFQLPDQSQFEDLGAALTNEVAQFEGATPAPPPAVRESQGPAP